MGRMQPFVLHASVSAIWLLERDMIKVDTVRPSLVSNYVGSNSGDVTSWLLHAAVAFLFTPHYSTALTATTSCMFVRRRSDKTLPTGPIMPCATPSATLARISLVENLGNGICRFVVCAL